MKEITEAQILTILKECGMTLSIAQHEEFLRRLPDIIKEYEKYER